MKTQALVVFFGALASLSQAQVDRCPDFNPFATGRSYNPLPTGEFGQPRLTPVTSHNPNYVEGRELFQPYAIALDNSTGSKALYVSDTRNNRVLVWKDRTAFTKGNMADMVIGQRDLLSTDASGPATDFPSGLTAPSGLVVDSSGNLYVVDTGNNRILRYPTPLKRPDLTPDLIIGQKTLRSGNSPNEGLNAPSASTIATFSGSTLFLTSITLDSSGNLWFADSANNRVLRYPTSQLAPNTVEPVADLVMGQTTFSTSTQTPNLTRWSKNGVLRPSGLAFSQAGDLYISDAIRVLYYQGTIANFASTATRVLGFPTPTAADPAPNAQNGCPATGSKVHCDIALGSGNVGPEGLAVLNNQLFVADPGNHRIVKFDTPDKWPTDCNFSGSAACPAGTAISPTGIMFVGQADGLSNTVNRGLREPTPSTFASPQTIAFDNSDLYVTDAGNNRLLVFPAASGGAYPQASRVLGQLDFPYNGPNLVDNRSLFTFDPTTGASISGVAVDTTSDPPHLYIADPGNNRVLGFRDARKIRPGVTADLVIGQPDFFRSVPNYGTTDASIPSDTSILRPAGVAVDSQGNLYIADAGNGRVVRFPRPFDQTGAIRANLVLGQPTFNSNPANSNPSASTMAGPYGLAFTSNGNLLVSDTIYNRVLLFTKAAGGDFSNGQASTTIFGQASETATGSGSDLTQMKAPRGIATDTSDRLYVADTGNQRIMVFNGLSAGTRNPRASFTQSISSPFGVVVGQLSGEIWVTDGGGRILRFPEFTTWALNPTQALTALSSAGPIGIALDSFENPIITDLTNRVVFHYIRATFANAASFVSASSPSGSISRPLAPGMLAYVCRAGLSLDYISSIVVRPDIDFPTILADTQVFVNGVASPIYYVNTDRVAFQVPWETPIDNVEVQLVRQSTGQILSSATIPIDVTNPAFFAQGVGDLQGQTQIAATNEDGTVNTASNPLPRGHVIALYGTGLGVVNNPPPDGKGASGLIEGPEKPVISLNPGGAVPAGNVQYFGLVSWAAGVFQLQFVVPDTVPPSNNVVVAFFYRGKPSNASDTSARLTTTIAVK